MLVAGRCAVPRGNSLSGPGEPPFAEYADVHPVQKEQEASGVAQRISAAILPEDCFGEAVDG